MGELERWLWQHGNYCLPTSTVEDVFSLAGVLLTASHGTGKRNAPMCDALVACEFFDEAGVLQRVTRHECDPKWLQRLSLPKGDGSTGELVDVQLRPDDVFRALLCCLGSFGIMWSFTLVVQPGRDVYFSAKLVPWRSLFDDSEEARENLFRLAQRHASIECFYFPFRRTSRSHLRSGGVDLNPTVLLWTCDYDAPTDGTPVEDPCDYTLLANDLLMHWLSAGCGLVEAAVKVPWLLPLLPQLCAQITDRIPLSTTSDGRPCVWRVPQFRANHPLNSAPIESMRALNIEWAFRVGMQSRAKFDPSNRVFGDIIRGIHAAYHRSSNPFDSSRYPISIAAEMRIVAPSAALMSPLFDAQVPLSFGVYENDRTVFCCPEIVTHSGNRGWDSFYQKMHAHFVQGGYCDGGPRVHLAKEFAVVPGMLRQLRASYRREAYGASNPFDVFCAVRNVVDPSRRFCNQFLHQFLYSERTEYSPPMSQPVVTDGSIGQGCLDALVLLRRTGSARRAITSGHGGPVKRAQSPMPVSRRFALAVQLLRGHACIMQLWRTLLALASFLLALLWYRENDSPAGSRPPMSAAAGSPRSSPGCQLHSPASHAASVFSSWPSPPASPTLLHTHLGHRAAKMAPTPVPIDGCVN